MNLSKLTSTEKQLAGLLTSMALVHAVFTALDGNYPLFALVFELPLVILAVLVIAQQKWAKYVAVVLSGLMFVLTLFGQLSDMAQGIDLVAAILFLILSLGTTIIGVWSLRA